MPDEIAIKVENVSKVFKLPHEKNNSIKSAVINFYKRNKTFEKQQVLKDISFEIKKGEFFGIVGRNGSGKSTLLKMLAGIYSPTTGSIIVEGKLTPFIELGVGFNPELTGRENVFLNGALLGLSRKEMTALYDDIVDFAELHKFMDQKLKNYSSGMQVRLAFSIAVRAKSDILVLDEVLAVGDSNFQKKCYNYFKELKKNKKTVVFVSHDSNALAEYCDRGIVIETGEIVINDDIEKCLSAYAKILLKSEVKAENNFQKIEKHRYGTQDMVIVDLKAEGDNGNKKNILSDEDKNLKIKIQYKTNRGTASPIYGITIHDASGRRAFVSNTMWQHVKTTDTSPGEVIKVEWEIPNIFANGEYSIVPAVAGSGGTEVHDQVENQYTFKVDKVQSSTGYTNPKYNLRIL